MKTFASRPLPALLAMLMVVPASAQQPVQELPVSARVPGDYRALREKPLFAPDRKAAEPMVAPEEVPVVQVEAPAPPPPAAAAPDWELVGLVRSSRVSSAMFRSGGQPEFSLRKGESRDGWTLTEIGRFEVILDSGAGRAAVGFPATR